MNHLIAVLFIGLFFNLFPSCSPQNVKQNNSDKLEQFYKLINTYPDNASYLDSFFIHFPESFEEFCSLYSFRNKLVSNYPKHLKLFDSLSIHVEETKYAKKLIGLGLNGIWNADAIGSLQRIINRKFKLNPDLYYKTLINNFTDQEIESFFYFYFDSMYPSNEWEGFPDFMKNYSVRYPRTVDISMVSFKKVMSK